jgi:hypothetical protein
MQRTQTELALWDAMHASIQATIAAAVGISKNLPKQGEDDGFARFILSEVEQGLRYYYRTRES